MFIHTLEIHTGLFITAPYFRAKDSKRDVLSRPRHLQPKKEKKEKKTWDSEYSMLPLL